MTGPAFLKRTGTLAMIVGVTAFGVGDGLRHAAYQAAAGDNPALVGADGHSQYVASMPLEEGGIDLAAAGAITLVLGLAAGTAKTNRTPENSPQERSFHGLQS